MCTWKKLGTDPNHKSNLFDVCPATIVFHPFSRQNKFRFIPNGYMSCAYCRTVLKADL